MKGIVDQQGRALLNVEVQPGPTSPPVKVDVWVDTGFTGELVLPQPTIDSLGLRPSGSVDAILADGSQLELQTYTCFVNWFGEQRPLEVVANQGDHPLLGVGMLWDLDLHISYRSTEMSID